MHRKFFNVFNENHAMGITHRHAGDLKRSTGHLQRHRDNLFGGRPGHRQVGPGQSRDSHIDLHPINQTGVAEKQLQRQNAVAGLNTDRQTVNQAMIMSILGNAADTVATHLRLATVSIEHAHFQIGLLRRQDQDQAV